MLLQSIISTGALPWRWSLTRICEVRACYGTNAVSVILPREFVARAPESLPSLTMTLDKLKLKSLVAALIHVILTTVVDVRHTHGLVAS